METSASPFNLSDVVPFREASLAGGIPSRKMSEAALWAERVSIARSMKQTASAVGGTTWEEGETLDGILKKWATKATRSAMEVLATDRHLPKSLPVNSKLTRLGGLPTVDMGELRRVVDVLGMVIMPWAYLKPASYEGEGRGLKNAIRVFEIDAKPAFNVYVAAPVQYYDAALHVAAEEDLPIFAANNIAPTFLAMGMALPMFRSIAADIKALKGVAREHSQRLRVAEQQIRELNSRVDQLQAQAERQQAEQIRQNLRQAKMETELRAARERTSFMAYDPMMVAIPKGRSVMDDGHAIVGPCWGPDFDAIVMTALKLRKYEGQRATHSKAVFAYASANYCDE